MTKKLAPKVVSGTWTRREFLSAIVTGGVVGTTGLALFQYFQRMEPRAETFITKVTDYNADIKQYILRGFQELHITSAEIKGKKVLLKPNLVEPHSGAPQINTHPLVIHAAVEAFFQLGAAEVVVAEGAGHRRDSLLVLEESGLADVLYEDKVPFVDLNTSPVVSVENSGKFSKLDELFLPRELLRAALLVSLPKMKTHHLAGISLSMKNLFGCMPGIVYGWPKNVLHWAGIHKAILDINATVKPNLAIVDGIVGMEGDGPIMGSPIQANVLVVGRNLPAVDATCARIMGINPEKIPYLKCASGRLGAIQESNITQRGENIASVHKDFQLLDFVPAHRGLRMGTGSENTPP